MTPDEAMQHEWIQEARLNKLRPKTRPMMRKPSESMSSTENNYKATYRKIVTNRTGKTRPLACFFSLKSIFTMCQINLWIKPHHFVCVKHHVLPFYIAAEKIGSDSNNKLKRDLSAKAGGKMVTAERLRPIGASAEEQLCEGVAKVNRDTNHEASEERPVHIIIKPQLDVGTDGECQESSQCLPPIM